MSIGEAWAAKEHAIAAIEESLKTPRRDGVFLSVLYLSQSWQEK